MAACRLLSDAAGIPNIEEVWERLQQKAEDWGMNVDDTAQRLLTATSAGLAPEW